MLIRVTAVEVCDATKVDSSTTADLIIGITIKRL